MPEVLLFLILERQARFPNDIIFGISHVGRSTTKEEFVHSTRENLQIALGLALRNVSKRAGKQKANKSKLRPVPEFTPEHEVLVYKEPHQPVAPVAQR